YLRHTRPESEGWWPSVPNPRVDHGVDEVDGQVRESDQDGVDSKHADGDVVVVLEDALNEFLAKAGDAENVLDDDTAGDDADDGRPEDARDRHQRVSQGVPDDDDAVLQDLGASGPNVVLLNDFEHRCPRDAGDLPRGIEAERDRRQRKLGERPVGSRPRLRIEERP